MTQARRPAPTRVPVPADKMAAAAEHEADIAARAATERDDASELTPELFARLYPLLREPIHEGYVETVTAGEGKPYDSTGIRSVQVQHDRMNSVLTPLWWREEVEYHEGGKLCQVSVIVLVDAGEDRYLYRSSWGGVDRGSSLGNVYKGSYTNAAKVAFARIGPGHEIYVGALDFDPDVSEQVANAQAKQELPDVTRLDAEQFGKLRDHFDLACPEKDSDTFKDWMDAFKMQLGAMGVAGASSVNEALVKLTPAQAEELSKWLAEHGN